MLVFDAAFIFIISCVGMSAKSSFDGVIFIMHGTAAAKWLLSGSFGGRQVRGFLSRAAYGVQHGLLGVVKVDFIFDFFIMLLRTVCRITSTSEPYCMCFNGASSSAVQGA